MFGRGREGGAEHGHARDVSGGRDVDHAVAEHQELTRVTLDLQAIGAEA
jgi:hypothetical protein